MWRDSRLQRIEPCSKEQVANYEDTKVCTKFLDQGRCSVNHEETPLNYSPDPSLHGGIKL